MADEPWRATSAVTGRLATEDDVKTGKAAFYLSNSDESPAHPFDIELPKLAEISDEDTGISEVVTVIQAETCRNNSGEMHTLIGYRTSTGEIGVCSIEEITWIEGSS